MTVLGLLNGNNDTEQSGLKHEVNPSSMWGNTKRTKKSLNVSSSNTIFICPFSFQLGFFSPCLRRCSTILRSTRGTPSSNRLLCCSSFRDTPNCWVGFTVLGRSMGIWTIFFMSSLTCTAVLLCCGKRN